MASDIHYGHHASLFPRTKVEEGKITSIFFAVMEVVQPLRARLLKSIKATSDLSPDLESIPPSAADSIKFSTVLRSALR